jgi:type 1 fimbriae regulatory protein FimB
MKDLKKPRTAKSRARKYAAGDVQSVQSLNEEELAALFRAIHSPRDVALFAVSLNRGLRASEVGLLQISDLRLSAKRLFVHRLKGGYSGEYPLTDQEVRALRRWLAVRGTEPGPLFPSREGGAICRARLHGLMGEYATRAGLPESKRHFHCIRHTAGTMLCEKTDVADAKDRLGHRDIRSTKKYVPGAPRGPSG